MANIFSDYSFDQSNLDLNRIFKNAFDSGLLDNYDGVYNGVTYTDLFVVDWFLDGFYYGSVFGGPNINYNESLSTTTGTVTGYIETVWNGSTYEEIWGIEGVEIDASDIYAASNTRFTSDDFEIINTALSGSDTFFLSDYQDWAFGYGGADILYGYGGNDTLDGGSGNDKLYGGNNNDKLYGGTGTDYLSGGSSGDRLYGESGKDTLKGGSGNDKLYGGSSGDKLYGESGTDYLSGGSSGDRLYGQSGKDTLKGGSGNDKLYGGSSGDKLYGESGTDYLSGGSSGDRLYGQSGKDTLKGGSGNDKLYGGSSGDKLYGGTGTDYLSGGSSGDRLYGQSGKDTLKGGTGADTFVFRKTSDSAVGASKADIITDFKQGVDTIDLHDIDASTKLSGNNAFTFDGTKSFGTSSKGDIYYDKVNKSGTKNDYTMVYIDTDNDRDAEMSIKLMGLHNLTVDDFIL